MSFCLEVARSLARGVSLIGRMGSWLLVVLVGVVIFDATCRKFFRHLPFVIDNDLHHIMNSPVLQDAEWHLHTMVFFLSIGYAYVHNAHVRLDLFRPRLSVRGRLYLEVFGGLVLLLPFLGVLLWFGWDFFAIAWEHDERSWNAIGINDRWFIKSFVVFGLVSMLAAAVSVVTRSAIRLWGPKALAERTEVDRFAGDSSSPFE